MKKGFGIVYLEGIAILIGTIIGAGVLAIPYAISKAGFLTGLLDLIILSAVVLFLYLYMGEIVLATKGKHQLTGYAQKYLGKTGKTLMTFTMVFGIYGALIAYLIGVGKSLAALFGLQGTIALLGIALPYELLFSFLFFIIGATIVYLGVKAVGGGELLMVIVIGIILIVSFLALTKADFSNLNYFDAKKLFIPFGVILFALSGAVAIPEMKEELKNPKRLKRAIIIGTLIPIFLYLLFAFSVIAALGFNTTEIATIGLGKHFGEIMTIFSNLFAVFAMSTSFFTLGLGLKEMYNYDYKIKKAVAWILACFIPLLLFLLVIHYIPVDRFYKVISLAGGSAMALEGILIVLMHNKVKKLKEIEPAYKIRKNILIYIILIALFALGMIYTILNFVGLV
ncbi:amino acid permease [Candidatus Pacearchaeota archaeon]|nr:amino acid permease [Candidatus Pacearchaeota archaeon]